MWNMSDTLVTGQCTLPFPVLGIVQFCAEYMSCKEAQAKQMSMHGQWTKGIIPHLWLTFAPFIGSFSLVFFSPVFPHFAPREASTASGQVLRVHWRVIQPNNAPLTSCPAWGVLCSIFATLVHPLRTSVLAITPCLAGYKATILGW